jgi:hypothetical protein
MPRHLLRARILAPPPPARPRHRRLRPPPIPPMMSNPPLRQPCKCFRHCSAAVAFNPRAATALGGHRSSRDTAVRLVNLVYAVMSGTSLLEDNTPSTFREAIEGPESSEWWTAMKKEFNACMAQKTWRLVPLASLPKGTNVLPVKWVYKKKTDETGALTQFKGRITPKGFRQLKGKDYFEVFAHTGKYKTLRVALALAAAMDLEINQLDVPSAFVRADLEEEVYMEMPEGFREPGMVCLLEKSLYGLKQSPRNWYRLLSSFIVDSLGWTATVSDPCLFVKYSRDNRPMLLFVFVDDMQGFYDIRDLAEWNETKAELFRRFETKDLGDSKWMLGMRITRDRAAGTIKLDQELYVTKALERYGLDECRPARTPAAVNHGAPEDDRDGAGAPTDLKLYQEKIGVLLYAAISTRPDISFAVNALSRHVQSPLVRHMNGADRVFRYLAGTRDTGLVFGRSGRASVIQLDAFSDADWAADKIDRISVSGWIARINGDPVSWQSKKQSSVALSSCESELYAECSATQELLWLRGLMKELRFNREQAVLYGDNQSAIATAKNGVRSERTKHIDIRYHFITDVIERGRMRMQWIPTAQQQADILTKALHVQPFELLRKKIMSE